MEGLSVVFDPDLIQFAEFNLRTIIIDSMKEIKQKKYYVLQIFKLFRSLGVKQQINWMFLCEIDIFLPHRTVKYLTVAEISWTEVGIKVHMC